MAEGQMQTFVGTGAGFLLAVLWFDLMFDVQVRGKAGVLPDATLNSIAAYYRRVTTDARPMNRLVPVAMLFTLVSIAVEIALRQVPLAVSIASLALAASAVGLAMWRTVRNAVAIGRGEGSVEHRSSLARRVYGDHVYCFAAMACVILLQLAVR
jgi:hypothetical protein